jgi:hypothetical protein
MWMLSQNRRRRSLSSVRELLVSNSMYENLTTRLKQDQGVEAILTKTSDIVIIVDRYCGGGALDAKCKKGDSH